MNGGALVLPVSLVAAVAWSRGWIGDVELLHENPARPEAVYWATLPDLAAWRRSLPAFLEYYRQGATVVIMRTDSPAVVHHAEKWGMQRTHQDPSGRWRYLATAATVERYFGRMLQKAAASSTVTSSR